MDKPDLTEPQNTAPLVTKIEADVKSGRIDEARGREIIHFILAERFCPGSKPKGVQ